MKQTFPEFGIFGGNMHKTPRYRGYVMCTKWFLRRLAPNSPLPHLEKVSLYGNE